MTIAVACDICAQRHDLKDAAIGRSLKCKACGVEFLVSAENAPQPAGNGEDDDASNSVALWVALRRCLAGVAIIAALAGMIALVFLDPYAGAESKGTSAANTVPHRRP